MNKRFDHAAIEKKWQQAWKESKIYQTDSSSEKPKCFVLDMFPYPSGEGLHVGHPKGYIATDIYSRFMRMTGHEVLHPMGWDAFGLPAENYAIKNKVHPRAAVDQNVENFKSQLEKLGFDYDWSREINTTDPAFYKWTQWIFIQLFKKGLAFESHEPINWCPGCQTGLANEDLEADGTCERCDSVVEKRPMRQWTLRIRGYADRLLSDLDTLDWPEHIKEAQRNWIGKSEGAEIDFTLSTGDQVTVFTTRPDTLYGATYMVLTPEHTLVQQHKNTIENWDEVAAYIEEVANKKEMDRLDDTKEKTGIKLEGVTATNPASDETIPVYIADYVLASYGTGAIMAVPAHDERDYAFAKQFGIEVKQVVVPAAPDGVDASGLILKTTDGHFLYQRRDLHAPSNPGGVAVFGGGMEVGETVWQTVVRETKEELMLDLTKHHSSHRLLKFHQRKDGKFVAIFVVEDIDPSSLTLCEGAGIIQAASAADLKAEKASEFLQSTIALALAGVNTGVGELMNSNEFDGMSTEEAKVAITKKVGGRMTSTYKIKDWVFSRQRYWGEPFPIVHLADGTAVPVAESQLPVTLPDVEHYAPAGDGRSPLANIDDWVNVTGYLTDDGDFMVTDEAPAGKELVSATRETNTMPQWAGSSWYYLRYVDPGNTAQLIDPAKEKDWLPVDVYVGGDHAVRHLIYARFWHKFLYDIGVVSTTEPFKRLEFLGFILAENGRKMSKRWGNVINPDDIVALVGADTMRVYEMFMGPFENTIAWSQDGLVGARRFLERVYGLSEHIADNEPNDATSALHKTIKKVSGDIETFKFNTAISTMMIYINTVEKTGLTNDSYMAFLRLLAPFAPHITEELWSETNGEGSVHTVAFPTYDADLAKDQQVTIGVQVNGKVRGNITIAPNASEAEALAAALADKPLANKLPPQPHRKLIYVPGRILNIVQ
jgi:leucyl-tRNA synthetase